jgi:DNA polymerase III delta prime subunit
VRYAREKSETKERENIEKSYIQEKENEEKLHAILYGADGLMQKKINVIKHELDSLKSVYEEFALTKEMKDEIVKGALVKMDSALVTWGFNDTEKLKDDKGAFLGEYKNELQKLLDSY